MPSQKIKRPIPGKRPEIPRQRFKVGLDFGLHLGITSEPLKQKIREFRPHAYVLESAWTPKGEREEDNRGLKESLRQIRQMAGGGPEKIKKILEAFKASGNLVEGFEAAQVEAMLSSPTLTGHYVEEYPGHPLFHPHETSHLPGLLH